MTNQMLAVSNILSMRMRILTSPTPFLLQVSVQLLLHGSSAPRNTLKAMKILILAALLAVASARPKRTLGM